MTPTLQELRAKIVEVFTEIEDRRLHCYRCECESVEPPPEITIADVLRAVWKEKRRGLNSPNLKRLSEFSDVLILIDLWDLTILNLDDKLPEVHTFLLRVLENEV